ncbi:MAG: discoidin domain-containing protein [Rhodothermales bacterium]|nr:discoidin domain-containing protein [Rhodothermales bacterium]
MKVGFLPARQHPPIRRISIAIGLFLGIWSMIGCRGVAQSTGELPADRFPAQGWSPIVWDDPGGWTTVDVTTLGITPAVADAAPLLQEVANNAGSPTIFYFPPGTYTLLSAVDIKEDNVILRGAGPDLTRLVIDGAGGHEIRFIGWQEAPIAVIANVPANGVTLALASAGTLSVGDLIEVSQDLPEWEADWGKRSWGQIVKIMAISGNSVTVDMPLSLGLSVANGPSVMKMHPVKNVGVEALAIERKAYGESNNLEFRSVYNGFVRDVESYNAVKFHIQLYRVRDVVIEGNYIHHAQNYGTGGHGYGVDLEQLSTRILVTNNIFENLRHHILVQTGVNHSIISYNYNVDLVELVDVSLHGHYPNHNLYEGNLFWWGGVADFWGQAGPENTFFRNRIQGKTSGGAGLSIYDRSNRQNVIANHVLRGAGIEQDGEIVDTYEEGNIVDGAPVWNTLSASADLPASLYLDAAPDFWPTNLPWPAIGPDVSGSDLNDIPAKMRYEGTLGGGGGDPVNERPSVALTSPANGTNYPVGSDIRLEAGASDADGIVQGVSFWVDGVEVADVLIPPYAFTWEEVPEGAYTLTAVARDNAGASTVSAEVFVSVSSEEEHEVFVSEVTASAFREAAVPQNTLDGDLATRWAATGDGVWIQYALSDEATLSSVGIAWHKGESRQAVFDLLASVDGENWTALLEDALSSGLRKTLEYYDFPDIRARYVRIVGHGTTVNDATSITEASLSIDSLSPFIAGDASGNGSVSAQDAALVLAHAVGISLLTGTASTAADVSGNTDLSALDASLILRFVTGLITCFPSEGNCDTVSALPSALQLPGRAVRTR